MLRMYSSPRMRHGVDCRTKMPVIHRALLRYRVYRGNRCYVETMGFYHLTIFRSEWFNDRMKEYSEDLIQRSLNNA